MPLYYEYPSPNEGVFIHSILLQMQKLYKSHIMHRISAGCIY